MTREPPLLTRIRNWLLVKLAAGDTVIINAGFDRVNIYRQRGAFIHNSQFYGPMKMVAAEEHKE